MNVHGLNEEQRRRLKSNLTRHRDNLDGIIKRMQALGWFTDDPIFHSMLAARHALHAAINSFAPPVKPTPTPAEPPAWAGYPKPIEYAPHRAGK